MKGSACFDEHQDRGAAEARSETRIATQIVHSAPGRPPEERDVRVIAGPHRTLGMITLEVQVGPGVAKVYFTHAGADGFATGANGDDAKAAVAVARQWVRREG